MRADRCGRLSLEARRDLPSCPANLDDATGNGVLRERRDVGGAIAAIEGEQREDAADVVEQPTAGGSATGASAAGAPGTIAPGPRRNPASRSGVLSGESARIAGTDSRPLLTSRRANG